MIQIQHVFGALEPYKVASDLGLHITEEKGRFFIAHPQHPKTRLFITSSEFISSHPNCNFIAGSVFDFLALFLGGYDKAVQHVIDRYRILAVNTQGHSLDSLKPFFEQELKQCRQQFMTILSLRQNLLNRHPKFVSAILYLRKNNLSDTGSCKHLYISDGSELNKLLNFSAENCIKFNELGNYLVLPYFSNTYTFSKLVVKDVETEAIREIKLNPVKFSYFGLHSCLSQSEHIQVFDTPWAAVSAYAGYVDYGQSKIGCLHVVADNRSQTESHQIPDGMFVASEETNLDDLVSIRPAFGKFSVSDKELDPLGVSAFSGISWERFVIERLRPLLGSQALISPQLSSFMASLKPDHLACQTVVNYLQQIGRFDVLEQLKFYTSSDAVYRLQNLEIVETPRGYVARKNGVPGESAISNFIIKMDQNIWFEDSQEVYYAGRVIIDNQEFGISIPHKFLSRPNEIARLATSAVFSGNQSPISAPVISDTTYKNRISEVLTEQVRTRPKINGIQKLGWNTSRTQFTTPTWQTRISGCSITSKIGHPNSDFLKRYYSFSESSTVTQTDQVPPQARTLLAIVCAQLARSFLQLPCPVVKVLRSSSSLNVLHAIFMALGQAQPIELNSNIRQSASPLDLSNLSSYPVFGLAWNEKSVENFNYPLILLHDSGIPYYDVIDNQIVNQLYSLSRLILPKLTVGLLRTGVGALPLFNPKSDLIVDGKNLIEKFCDIPRFDIFEPDFPQLHQLLSEIPFFDLPDFFKFDMTTQRIVIQLKKVESSKRQIILNELRKVDPTAWLRSTFYLSASAPTILNLLTKFYGQAAKFFHTEEAKTDFTGAPDDSAQSVTS